MNVGWKSLAWSFSALVLLFLVATPLNLISLLLLMTPFVVLFATLKPSSFIVHTVPVLALPLLLLGSSGAILSTIGFFFFAPSIVMGYLYKKGATARKTLLFGTFVILAQLLVEFALLQMQFNLDLSAELASMMNEAVTSMNVSDALPAGFVSDVANLFVDLLPTLLILSSFLFALTTHGLSRFALRKSGLDVQPLPQAKTWRLPRNLVFYFLVALVASFFLSPDASGYWPVAIRNVEMILQYAFTAQAIGFFFFLADAKKWSKAVPIVLIIPLILIPPLYLIGLFDTAFPLRRYFVKE